MSGVYINIPAERFCNGDHAPDDAPQVEPLRLERRSGEGRGKVLDARSAGPILVEIFGGSLCPAVGVVWLMMIIINIPTAGAYSFRKET
jgi:hypothetical protein